MGDRLRDYGFVNPFRRNQNLSGNQIDQWLVDTAAYNKIIKDYGLTSQIEYKQPDGSWGTTPPPAPKQNVVFSQNSTSGFNVPSEKYSIHTPSNNASGFGVPSSGAPNVNVMPEYRWRVSGDVDGANSALNAAGLGVNIKSIAQGPSVTATQKGYSAMGSTVGGGTYKLFVDSQDPLGMGMGESGGAFARAYQGQASPTYYTFVGSEPGSKLHQTSLSPSYGLYQAKQIADQVFSNPNLGSLIYEPNSLREALNKTPAIRDQIGTYINDTSSFWRSRDDGGGALGVIAAGLGGVAQFAAMASGLNALVTGLGSLASGLGLKGAFNAALDVAGAMPDIGSVVGGAAGSSSIGNLANIAVGGITGAEAGGVPGALLGAGGALIGAGIDQAGGIREFIRDPFGNITGAIGLGGELLSGAELAAMQAAGQINLGSTAQNLAGGVPDYSMEVIGGASNLLGGGTGSSLGGTIGSAIGGNLAGGSVVSAPGNVNFTGSYVDPTTGQVVEQYEVIAESGDTTQAGGGMGSSAGGGAGSAIGDMLGGGGASTGPSSPGGLLDGNVTPGTPGSPTGSIQTTAPGTTPTAGTGTGQTGTIGGPGGIGPDGMPIGTPSPYSDAYGQTPMGTGTGTGTMYGVPGADAPGMSYEDQQLFGTIPGIMIPMGGSWNYTGAPTGTTTGIPDGFGPGPGTTGLLDTGPGPGGPGPGGSGPGGDGLGGDGTGGDGLGGGNNFGGFNYSGLLGGTTPGGMGDPVSFLTPRAFGTKKKGPASFYGKLQAPKKRKGITVRRA